MRGFTRAGMEKRGGMTKIFWAAIWLWGILAVAGCGMPYPGAYEGYGSGCGYGGMGVW